MREGPAEREGPVRALGLADDAPRRRVAGREQRTVRGREERRHQEKHQRHDRPRENHAASTARRRTRRSCLRHMADRVRASFPG